VTGVQPLRDPVGVVLSAYLGVAFSTLTQAGDAMPDFGQKLFVSVLSVAVFLWIIYVYIMMGPRTDAVRSALSIHSPVFKIFFSICNVILFCIFAAFFFMTEPVTTQFGISDEFSRIFYTFCPLFMIVTISVVIQHTGSKE
jgi:hypothetical protein